MNFFCRLFGHTWVPTAEDPRIRWNADKDGLQLNPTVEGQPRFFERCARCRDVREAAPLRSKVSGAG